MYVLQGVLLFDHILWVANLHMLRIPHFFGKTIKINFQIQRNYFEIIQKSKFSVHLSIHIWTEIPTRTEIQNLA